MFNFDFDMTSTYQMEYEFNMISKDDLRTYVEIGILSKEGYKTILGEDYETGETGIQEPAN